jgi:hypothetical protein
MEHKTAPMKKARYQLSSRLSSIHAGLLVVQSNVCFNSLQE